MKFHFIFLVFLLDVIILVSGCSSCPTVEKQKECTFDIVQSKFLGSLWNESHAKASIISQDGGQFFIVPGGAIWTFGDTFKGSRSTDGAPEFSGGAVSCCIAFFQKNAKNYPPAFTYLTSSDGDAISPFEFYPDESWKRNRIWPLGGIYVNDHYYLYYSLIEIVGKGEWDFREIGFGLARVRPGKIEDPGSYEFYTSAKTKFSSKKEASSLLVENVAGQVSVAWNKYLGKYMMAVSSDFRKPREIRFHIADVPYGPWSPPIARIEVPESLQGKHVDLVYCTYLHPELFREDGRIMNLTFTPRLHEAGFDGNCEMVEIELKRQNSPTEKTK